MPMSTSPDPEVPRAGWPRSSTKSSCPGAVIQVVAPRTPTVVPKRSSAVRGRSRKITADLVVGLLQQERSLGGVGQQDCPLAQTGHQLRAFGERTERGGIDDEHGAGCHEGCDLPQQ